MYLSMIRERIIKLVDFNGSSQRKRFKDFERATGIASDTVKQFYHGNQSFNLEQLELINKAFPKYATWIATGKTIPEAGHISPELEEVTDSHGEIRY